MEYLISLLEKRKEIGRRPAYTNGGNYGDMIEFGRISELIIKEVYRLYDSGALSEKP